ncbi:sortase [Patescibacteria group bacterium]|nr:sortase [Patescibacteria group bacterium]
MKGGNHIPEDIQHIAQKPWEFLAVFLATFFVFSTVLFALDFYPEAPKTVAEAAKTESVVEQTVSEPKVAGASVSTGAVLPVGSPVRIRIPSVGIDTPIQNPSSTDITVLDNALLKGAVRYPGSALPGQDSRMFIFGHQSGLPVVKNQAFKAFNNLQNVKVGTEIEVYSDTAVYRYRVISIEHASVNDGWVDLSGNDRMLILSTCDSFGKKTDRNIVRAEFVSQELL